MLNPVNMVDPTGMFSGDPDEGNQEDGRSSWFGRAWHTVKNWFSGSGGGAEGQVGGYSNAVVFGVAEEITYYYNEYEDEINSTLIFTGNFGGAYSSDVLTFGLANFALPDHEIFGKYELSSRLGRFAGHFVAAAQGGTDVTVGVVSEVGTLGGSTPASAALVYHGAVTIDTAIVGALYEGVGLVNYFAARRGGNSGNKSRGNGEPPSKFHNKQRVLAENGEEPHGIYQGDENPLWSGARYWYVRNDPTMNSMRVYSKLNSRGETVWGYTFEHHAKGKIHLFPGYSW